MGLRLIHPALLIVMLAPLAVAQSSTSAQAQSIVTMGEPVTDYTNASEVLAEPAEQPDLSTVMGILTSERRYSLFATMIEMAGLSEVFEDDGPKTVFVPTNEAILEGFDSYIGELDGEAYEQRLIKLVSSHLMDAQYSIDDLAYNTQSAGGRFNMETVNRDALTALFRGDRLYIFDERAGATPIKRSHESLSDGVIHELDGGMLRAR